MTESTTQAMETFAERLKRLRMEKGLSQSDLANLINVHNTHISRYERGESKPASRILNALADILKVSTDYLLNGTAEDAATANLEDKDLLKLFERLEKLEPDDKEKIKDMIDAFLMKKELKKKLAS
jgi:transcriptional regulator with XRE-family HTH domain